LKNTQKFQFLGASYNIGKCGLFKGVQMPKNILGFIEDFQITFSGKRPKGNVSLKIGNMYILKDITSSTNGVGMTRLHEFQSLDIHTVDFKNQKIHVFITGRIKLYCFWASISSH